MDAIAEWLLQITVTESDAPLVRARLDACRLPNGEIDFDRCLAHFEHIRRTVAIPDARVRFLGGDPDKGAARAAVIAGTVEANAAAFELIGGVAEGREKLDCVFVASGRLWVKARALGDVLATIHGAADRWSYERVTRALAPFRGKRDKVIDREG